MPSVLSQVGRWCRDQLVGPELPTYDRACEELGGAPWRPKPEATDRWFIVETPTRSRRATPPPIPALGQSTPPHGSAARPPSGEAVAKIAKVPGTARMPSSTGLRMPSIPPIPSPVKLPSIAANGRMATTPSLASLPSLPAAALVMPILPTLDSAAFVLKKSMSEGTKLTLLGGGALAVIVICVMSLLGGTLPPAAVIASAPVAAPVLLAALPPPVSPASPIVAKSSAPRSIASLRMHVPSQKRHVAARHRRR